ncbi:MAG: hypothetical protein KF690_12040, partial [Bacteroidetes bacterium]|nr:hypothetical protein [Bacteroidota bacterium]
TLPAPPHFRRRRTGMRLRALEGLESRVLLSTTTTAHINTAAGEFTALVSLPTGATAGRMLEIVTPPAHGTAAIQYGYHATPGVSDQLLYISSGAAGNDTLTVRILDDRWQEQLLTVAIEDGALSGFQVLYSSSGGSGGSSSYNSAPFAHDGYIYTQHGQVATGTFSGQDWDYDLLTISVSSSALGNLSLSSPYQAGWDPSTTLVDYTFTPHVGAVGSETLTLTVSDGEYSDVASVYVSVWNNVPVANEDWAYIEIPEQPEPFPIFVLDDDFDADGDELTITGVASPANGGTVWIDPSGLFLWYLPPDFPLTVIGPVGIPYYPDMSVSTAALGPYVELEMWNDFADFFTYTVSDPLGANDTGIVQVRAAGNPEWTWNSNGSLTNAAWKIDGEFGYDGYVHLWYGKNAKGRQAPNNQQWWQKNTVHESGVHFIPGQDGAAPLLGRTIGQTKVILDVEEIGGARTPIRLPDHLAYELPPDSGARMLYSVQWVEKKAGFAPTGSTLRTDLPNGRVASEAEIALLDTMIGPFNEVSTMYCFVDKRYITQLLTNGEITQGQFDTIKQDLADIGLAWESLPGVMEQYQLGHYHTLTYTED